MSGGTATSLPGELLRRLATHIEKDEWRSEFDAAWSAKRRPRRNVTVIVPVYDDAEALARLLSIECLFDEPDAIVFIDDRSDSPAVADLLNRAAKRRGKVRILRNERNLGFTESVNRGLQARHPGHDVVVLNTDAVPSSGWLAHLRLTADSRPDVASVTPLTNSAGYCSVPRPGVTNPLPSAVSIADCDALLGWIAPRFTEVAMAGCGFCWYVTADAIRRVGLLDERLYYRGYCEETDFCRRATDQGLVNLCLLTAYVGHEGHTSFASLQSRLRDVNVPTLHAVRPDFASSREQYAARSCLADLGSEFADLLDRIARRGSTPGGSSVPTPEKIVVSDEPELPERVLGLQPLDRATGRLRFAGHQCRLPMPREWLDPLLIYLRLRFGLQQPVA